MIILTGGAGFIGSHILERLNGDGYTDILVVDDLRESSRYRNLVGKKFADYIHKDDFYPQLDSGKWDHAKVAFISHQGACTDTMEYDGVKMMRDNFESSKSLLHFALRRGVKMVYASTAAVYGHNGEAVEREELEVPLNIYGYSKLAFDNYVRRHAPAGSAVVGLRYFNVYGPNESHKGRMSSMVIQLAEQIQATGVAKLFGEIGPYTAGNQTRDFVYVKDLVEINAFFQHRAPIKSIVNAGSGVRSTWNDLARSVMGALGTGRIEYIPFPDSLRDKYQFDSRADLTLLRELGYLGEMTSLERGVKEYLTSLEELSRPFSPKL